MDIIFFSLHLIKLIIFIAKYENRSTSVKYVLSTRRLEVWISHSVYSWTIKIKSPHAPKIGLREGAKSRVALGRA